MFVGFYGHLFAPAVMLCNHQNMMDYTCWITKMTCGKGKGLNMQLLFIIASSFSPTVETFFRFFFIVVATSFFPALLIQQAKNNIDHVCHASETTLSLPSPIYHEFFNLVIFKRDCLLRACLD